MASQENNENFIKNVVGVRRRPNMTRKEFYDHHFRVHGYLSDAPDDKSVKPHKYMQTHIFDSAFGNSSEGPNANHPWVGRDDVTELYFRDVAHLGSTFSSAYVHDKIMGDGPKFAEAGPPTTVMAREKRVPFNANFSPEVPEGQRTAEKVLSPKLVSALQSHAPNDSWGLIVNIAVDLKLDMSAFGPGSNMPKWGLVYKVLIKDRASTTSIRKAQHAFYEAAAEQVNPGDSFILFGIEGLINSVGQDVKVAQVYQSRKYPGALVLGDAAHIFLPSGGLGINTGFADAHNLIWKIDAVEKGWADAAVLGTYSQERRPVALANGRFSTANWLKMLALAREIYGPDLKHPEDPEERIKNPAMRKAITDAIQLNFDHFNSLKLQIGYVYKREPPAIPDASVYEPVFEAGARLPHMWLNLNGSRVSSLDLVDGKSFVVIASAGFVAPPLPWNSVGTRQIPVRIYRAVMDFSFVDSHWVESAAFQVTTGAWVIRPDQHILNSIADYKELEKAINAYLGLSQ